MFVYLSVIVFDNLYLFMVAVDISKVMTSFLAREAVQPFGIKLALKEIRLSDRDEMASITNVCLFINIIDTLYFLGSLCR